MNIETTKSNIQQVQNPQNVQQKTQKEGETSFSDELKNTEVKENKPIEAEQKNTEQNNNEKEDVQETVQESKKNENSDEKADLDNVSSKDMLKEDYSNEKVNENIQNFENSVDILKGAVFEMNNLHQEENFEVKDKRKEKYEDNIVIDNNMNIPEKQDKINLQMGNMNFNSNTQDNQTFSEYINTQKQETLSNSAKDIAEEKEILSTMSENIAIANKNMLKIKDAENAEDTNLAKTETVSNNEGIKKVDKNTHITVETVVKYDEIVMTKEDVDFFVNVVENKFAESDSNDIKSVNVSKTLADLIAKAMNDNKPIRINFDNDISVIIKISRDGKLSADFLPSSQIAEAYLRENLPLLKQKFDDNNIEYDELNQRKQKQDNEQENRKKDRKDE